MLRLRKQLSENSSPNQQKLDQDSVRAPADCSETSEWIDYVLQAGVIENPFVGMQKIVNLIRCSCTAIFSKRRKIDAFCSNSRG
eukprot:COSAG01_NODE_4430_length_5032_cov_3.903304_7_plen_84_part_00